MVVTDPFARLPEFLAWLHEFVAKVLNVHLGRWENFWATEPTSCVRLMAAEDVLAKVVYTLTNAVAAGLVERGTDWPGLRLFTPGRRSVRRPAGFFRDDGSMAEVEYLNIAAAPVGAGSEQVLLTAIYAAVRARETVLCRQRRQQGQKVLGVHGVLAQRPTDVPASLAPRRNLSPRIACRNKWLRLDALSRSVQFLRQYRAAYRAWSAKLTNLLFPAGSYRMRAFAVPVLVAAA